MVKVEEVLLLRIMVEIGKMHILQREADRSLDMLVEETKSNGSVNPLGFVRCAAFNVILATAFGME
ncbi:hypothetical protein ABG067_008856, partial [Albugo candida]